MMSKTPKHDPGDGQDDPRLMFSKVSDLLKLDAITIPERYRQLSIYYSLLYWQYFYEGKNLLMEDDTLIQSELARLNTTQEKDDSGILVLYGHKMKLSVYLLDQDLSFKKVFSNLDGHNYAILWHLEDGTFSPLVFKNDIIHPAHSASDLTNLIIQHVATTIEDARLSPSLAAKELHVALGSHLRPFLEKAFIADEHKGANVVFFGEQGAGKSFLINKILQASMQDKDDKAYSLELSWFWQSFQKFQAVTAELVDPLKATRDIYSEMSNFTELDDHEQQDWVQSYLVAEGSEMSTTCINTTIVYGIPFSVTIEFFSELDVENELNALIAYNNAKDLYQDDVNFRALYMLGFAAVAGKTLPTTRIDRHFQGKLGTKITFTSPYFSIERSLSYLKQKYLSYCHGSRNYWGLIKSVQFALPVPLLRRGGQIVDCPGPVHDNNLLEVQTIQALNNAATVVYVCKSEDFKGGLTRFEESTFYQRYAEQIEIEFATNELLDFKSKFVFVVQAKSWADNQVKAKIVSHGNKITNVIKQKFVKFAHHCAADRFPKDQLVAKRELMTDRMTKVFYNENLVYPNLKLLKLQGSRKFLVAANFKPVSNNVYSTPFPVTYVFFESKVLQGRETGVEYFINFVAKSLCENQDRAIDRITLGSEMLRAINTSLEMMSTINKNRAKYTGLMEEIISKTTIPMHTLEIHLHEWSKIMISKVEALSAHELTAAASNCNFANLCAKIKSLPIHTKDKEGLDRIKHILSKLCCAEGTYSVYSLSDLMLEPVWIAADKLLKKIGQMISYQNTTNDEFINFLIDYNNFSILNTITDMSHEIFGRDPSNNPNLPTTSIPQSVINAERKRFTSDMSLIVYQYQNLHQLFVKEKAMLRNNFRERLKEFLIQEESKLNTEEYKPDQRYNYVKKILPVFAAECAKVAAGNLTNFITKQLLTFTGTGEYSLIEQMNEYFRMLLKKYNTENPNSFDYTNLQSYFQAVHLSILHSALDTALPRSLWQLVLDNYANMNLAPNANAIQQLLPLLEWHHWFHRVNTTSCYAFEELKFLVNKTEFKEVLADNSTQTPSFIPEPVLKIAILELQEKFPLANGGLPRTLKGIKESLLKKFGHFANRQAALNFVNNNLNRSQSLRIAFDLNKDTDIHDLLTSWIILGLMTDEQFATTKNVDLDVIAKRANYRLIKAGKNEKAILTANHVQIIIKNLRLTFDSNREEALAFINTQIGAINKKRNKAREIKIIDLETNEEELIDEFESDEINNNEAETLTNVTPKKRKLVDDKENNTNKKSKK